MSKTIAFYTNQLCERGTTVAVYDYAHHNETYLGNKSIIIFGNSELNNDKVIDNFKNRFVCYKVDALSEIEQVIQDNNISHFYKICYGTRDNITPKNCIILTHAVFAIEPHSNKYAIVSHFLNKKNKTNIQVVPHMIDMPICNEHMRHELNIPDDATVFGRYGGYDTFNIQFVHIIISKIVKEKPNYYFIFLNTMPFYLHPQIIYLDKKVNKYDKAKFINSCNAMIHGRVEGETFGLSIGEFCFYNKPIITCISSIDNAHLDILKEKAIIYNDHIELYVILLNINDIIKRTNNWNGYKEYTPTKVMDIFNDVFLK